MTPEPASRDTNKNNNNNNSNHADQDVLPMQLREGDASTTRTRTRTRTLSTCMDSRDEQDVVDHLNGMNDLLSFSSPSIGAAPSNDEDDSHSVSSSTTAAAAAAAALILSPFSSSRAAPDSPDWRPLLNAVHMELQENAKLPTFHWNVNRTGSVPQPYPHHSYNPPNSTNPQALYDSSTLLLSPSLFKGGTTAAAAFANDRSATSNNNNPHPQHHQPSPSSSTSLMEHFLQKETQSRRHGRHGSYDYRSLNVNNNSSNKNINNIRIPTGTAPATTNNRTAAAATTTTTTTTGTTDPWLALLDNVDPTPLEEIKRKHMAFFIPQRRDPLPIPTFTATSTSTTSTSATLSAPTLSGTTTKKQPQQPQHKQQVPADSIITTPHLGSPSLLHDALATAAAIVKVATAADGDDPMTTTASSGSSKEPQRPQSHHPNIHNHHHPSSSSAWAVKPQFSARHAVPIRALQTASTQKSQYGFGRKHVVPSVPPVAAPILLSSSSRSSGGGGGLKAPPPLPAAVIRTPLAKNDSEANKNSGHHPSNVITGSAPTRTSSSGNTAINSNKRNDWTTSQSVSRTGGIGDDADDGDSSSPTNIMDSSIDGIAAAASATNIQNGNEAYERKKQRAKNARVRLNESIDRLGIAINLAGTQSQERATLLEQWNINNNNNSQGDHTSHSLPTTTTTTYLAGLMRECVTTAQEAKKWERFSFIGSAATLLQGMNAQCEALLREIQALREAVVLLEQQQQQQRHGCRSDNDHHSLFSLHNNKHSLDDLTANHHEKRQRLEDGDHHQHDNQLTAADRLVFAERTIMDRVASFLEPLSIVRCMRVSKAWKDWGVFSNEPLWENLAVERFGYFNVRQWRGLLEDHEPPPNVSTTATTTTMTASAMSNSSGGITTISSTLLYKKMDAANVMPHFRHEGMFLLGEARLPGKVSAWTFLVERSNGETMRSVLRPPGHPPSVGAYVSLPVVQLWTVLQNTGIHDEFIVLREQIQTVDASTRRRGEEFKEIDWDERFRKRILNLDGSLYRPSALDKNAATTTTTSTTSFNRELCRLKLFDTVILESNIHTTGCSTSSKFVQRSNFTKVFIQIRNGTTVPLVIPFPRESSHLYS